MKKTLQHTKQTQGRRGLYTLGKLWYLDTDTNIEGAGGLIGGGSSN